MSPPGCFEANPLSEERAGFQEHKNASEGLLGCPPFCFRVFLRSEMAAESLTHVASFKLVPWKE